MQTQRKYIKGDEAFTWTWSFISNLDTDALIKDELLHRWEGYVNLYNMTWAEAYGVQHFGVHTKSKFMCSLALL